MSRIVASARSRSSLELPITSQAATIFATSLCVDGTFCRLDVLRQFDFLRRILFDPLTVDAKAEELPEDLQFLVRSRLSDLPASPVSIQVLDGDLHDVVQPG